MKIHRLGWLILVGGLSLVLGLWVLDVRDDRNHTVLVEGSTPVYGGDEDCDARTPIAIVQQGSKFQAKRIRYWKNCATVSIQLNDGRYGFIVLGEGKASVSPELP